MRRGARWNHPPAGAGPTAPPPSSCRTGANHPRGRGADHVGFGGADRLQEPSPRARGRLGGQERFRLARGTIPAGAGPTSPTMSHRPARSNHPRGRGADSPGVGSRVVAREPSLRARGRPHKAAPRPPHRRTIPAGAGPTEWAPSVSATSLEPSPRARGRQLRRAGLSLAQRTIPAGAGPTRRYTPPRIDQQNHPRGRGADGSEEVTEGLGEEPSPRARGRLQVRPPFRLHLRTIPAGAGPTTPVECGTGTTGNHPRGRGADHGGQDRADGGGEPSPRARGRRIPGMVHRLQPGTIPAGAGPTLASTTLAPHHRNHPRGRGADIVGHLGPVPGEEPSPRARGRPGAVPDVAGGGGTIPAGAGPTCRSACCRRAARNHPRGRGADSSSARRTRREVEPSPRARGRPHVRGGRSDHRRTIPAGAGPTSIWASSCPGPVNHPRGRGADGTTTPPCPESEEPSPRARGRPLLTCDVSRERPGFHSVGL